MEARELKARLDLPTVAARLGVQLRVGYNACPFCNRPSKFRAGTDRYKCFHPECEANRGGDVIELVKLKKKLSFVESLNYLMGEFNIKDTGTTGARSASILSRALDAYVQCARRPEYEYLVEDWLTARGLEGLSADVGYCPYDGYLQELGFNATALTELGLVKNDREVLAGRLVFTIKDAYGNAMHWQGRALDPDESLRWYSSPTISRPIYEYAFNLDKHRYSESIWLAEGITDTLSLIKLKVPAAGICALTSDLNRILAPLINLKEVSICLDSDRYAPGTKSAGKYKSWTAALPAIVDFARENPDISVYCITPPERPGIKDVNDWLKESNLTADKLFNHARRLYEAGRADLVGFILNHYGNYPEYLPMLVSLVKRANSAQREEIRSKLLQEYPDWLDCLHDLCENFT